MWTSKISLPAITRPSTARRRRRRHPAFPFTGEGISLRWLRIIAMSSDNFAVVGLSKDRRRRRWNEQPQQQPTETAQILAKNKTAKTVCTQYGQ